MIQLAGSQKSVPLDPSAAEYFTSVSDLREVLITRTTQQVNSMIDKVVATATELFMPAEDPEPQDDCVPAMAEPATILRPDGTRAKVKIK